MSNKDTNIITRLFFSQKGDTTRFFQHILSKALWVLLPVIVTVLLAQAYYASNVNYQVKIEAEKDLYISQMETYNALQMIKKFSDKHSFKCKYYLGELQTYVFVDIFGNELKKDIVKDSMKVSFIDTTFSVPIFVCKKNVRADFLRYISILESNCMKLEPEASKQCNGLLSIISNYPLPDCDSLSVKTVVGSGWTSLDLQEEYYSLINELNARLEKKVKKFRE